MAQQADHSLVRDTARAATKYADKIDEMKNALILVENSDAVEGLFCPVSSLSFSLAWPTCNLRLCSLEQLGTGRGEKTVN